MTILLQKHSFFFPSSHRKLNGCGIATLNEIGFTETDWEKFNLFATASADDDDDNIFVVDVVCVDNRHEATDGA